ncbi:MAG: hypothetical protein J6A60_02715 [Clostridia bacterium]|nr:hypothetical protein [Clostridia bacterium]
MKKLICIILALAITAALPFSAFALTLDSGIEALKAEFVQAEGPVAGGYSVDYSYFSPVKENDTVKYPLVIWFHGMGDGSEPGAPVKKSNVAYWASDEFQARFDPAGGAFILAMRSREENGIYWGDAMLEPVRAAVDEFIAANKANIDLSRIYAGGYSMGGKMTLKTAVAYPEMFAAIFPICPAWSPSTDLTALIADIPVWLISGKSDPLVNYHLSVTPTWEKIIEESNVAGECRFSSLAKVCYPDGSRTSSSHHAWFAVNYDLFSIENGDYPHMSTVDGNGNSVELVYPEGMIAWLSAHTSDYDGVPGNGKGNITDDMETENLFPAENITYFLKNVFAKFLALLPC